MTKEIKLTQGKVVLVDDEDYEYLNQWKWYAHKQGKTFYAKRITRENNHVTMIHMHRVIMNCPPEKRIDHISRNGLDNRKCNLRLCNVAENGMNRPKQDNNSSGYKGVGWDKSRNKWRAQIKPNQKSIFIGRFSKKEDAAKAYDEFAKRYFGEFAYLNFPENQQGEN